MRTAIDIVTISECAIYVNIIFNHSIILYTFILVININVSTDTFIRFI